MCSYKADPPNMYSTMVQPSRSDKTIFGMMTWIRTTNRSYVACIRSPLVSLPHLLQCHTNYLSGQQDLSHISQGEQTASVSWWPKQFTWEASGLNVGYWSTDDEAWFQKHLKDIRKYHGTGNPPYHTAAEWRNKLKYHKVMKKVVAFTRDAAERWLLNHS